MATQTGFKFNHTAKEQAMKKLVEEQEERKSLVAYQNAMDEIGVEVVR